MIEATLSDTLMRHLSSETGDLTKLALGKFILGKVTAKTWASRDSWGQGSATRYNLFSGAVVSCGMASIW